MDLVRLHGVRPLRMEVKQIQSEFFKAINGSNGWQSLQHLMLKLKKEDPEKVLDALLGVFFGISDSHFRGQAAAGGLLWKLKPEYKRNLREDIKCSLQSWDISVEELPWYFAEVIGIEKVREEVKSILTETLDETSRKRAETYLYWLSVSNPEEFRTQLNRGWNGRLRG
jgi:hypothetical protein